MWISFGLTTKELLSGTKTVTRRDWKISRHIQWEKAWTKDNHVHDAWDKSPRNGGKKIGIITLTERPFMQALHSMTKQDFIAEGGMVDNIEDFCKLINKPPETHVTVLNFIFKPI